MYCICMQNMLEVYLISSENFDVKLSWLSKILYMIPRMSQRVKLFI